MPRPLEREKPLKRVNVMLDCVALEAAQKKAAQSGVSPSIVGSSSAFIRWLIDKYNEGAQMFMSSDELRSALRSTPKCVKDILEFYDTLESIQPELLGVPNETDELYKKRLRNEKLDSRNYANEGLKAVGFKAEALRKEGETKWKSTPQKITKTK